MLIQHSYLSLSLISRYYNEDHITRFFELVRKKNLKHVTYPWHIRVSTIRIANTRNTEINQEACNFIVFFQEMEYDNIYKGYNFSYTSIE